MSFDSTHHDDVSEILSMSTTPTINEPAKLPFAESSTDDFSSNASLAKGSHVRYNTSYLGTSPRDPDLFSPLFTLGSNSVTLLKTRKGANSRFVPAKQSFLKNSLLLAVGFLELGNAGDFAANVWNRVPAPLYAIVLMAIGGTLALALSIFILQDARLSWANLTLLRNERRRLQSIRAKITAAAANCGKNDSVKEEGCNQTTSSTRLITVDAMLDLNRREIGTEIVDRVGMEILLGGALVLVGTGTLMAIGGRNHRVWLASNLLSGYIGNVPSTIYGLVNAGWSTFIWRRARRHLAVATDTLDPDIGALLLGPRLRTIQNHAIVSGLTTFLAGVASPISATRWWGYVMLAPCIVSSIWCNYYWRRTVGQERPWFACLSTNSIPVMDAVSLVYEVRFVSFAQRILDGQSSSTLETHRVLSWILGSDSKCLDVMLNFIVRNDLFEDLCIQLLQDPVLASQLFNADLKESVTLTSQSLLNSDVQFVPRICRVMERCIVDLGPQRLLYRERYLLELLGCFLCAARKFYAMEVPRCEFHKS